MLHVSPYQQDHERALDQLGRRLEEWRRSNAAPTPIPSEIWVKAAELATRVGLAKVSKALRLDYSNLKKRVDRVSSNRQVPPTFVELLSPMAGGLGECALEVESAHGARMRVQINCPTPAGLACLLREFVA